MSRNAHFFTVRDAEVPPIEANTPAYCQRRQHEFFEHVNTTVPSARSGNASLFGQRFVLLKQAAHPDSAKQASQWPVMETNIGGGSAQAQKQACFILLVCGPR